jgi:hypothetical protein
MDSQPLDVKSSIAKARSHTIELLQEKFKSANLFKIIILLLIVAVLVAVIFWVFGVFQLADSNCARLKKVYNNETAPLNPISTDDVFNNPIYDFYIKTAYNCCSGGNFKNSFVDSNSTTPPFCALKTCIQQGARCLDFEIYSVNHEPVIATSSVNSFNIKETFNYLKFSDAMDFIADNAFSVSTTPVWSDPLFLNFRVMSDIPNNPIYPKIATALLNAFKDRLLDTKHNLMNSCKSIGNLPLSQFKGKVINIIDPFTYDMLKTICPPIQDCSGAAPSQNVNNNEEVGNKEGDRSISQCQSPNLLEFLNMHSGSPFLHTFRVKDLLLTDTNNLKYQNKTLMTILLPNFSQDAKNFNPSLGFSSGCQFVGMSFQNFDTNLEYYTLFFNKAGYSFAFKPANLRYIKVTAPAPAPYPTYTNVNRQPLMVTNGHGQQVNLINNIGPNRTGVDNVFPFPQTNLKNDPNDFSNT